MQAITYISLLGTAAAALSCYDSQKNEIDTATTNITLCQPNASVSGCCPYGFACLSNGLCEPTPEVYNYNNASYLTPYYFYGCSDPTLQSALCAPIEECSNLGISGAGLSSCNGDSYCCYGTGGCDCNNATQTFTLQGGSIITTILPPTSSSTVTSTTSPTIASSTATASTTTNSLTPSAASGKSTNSTAIGVGVGVGVGVVLIAIAAFVFFYRRRSKSKKAAMSFSPYNSDPRSSAPHYPLNPYAGEKPQYGDNPSPAYAYRPESFAMKPVQHQVVEAPSNPAAAPPLGNKGQNEAVELGT